MERKVRYLGAWIVIAIFAIVLLVSLNSRKILQNADEPTNNAKLVLATGYCNCGKCCGWKLSWFGFGIPVYENGPMKGKRKEVGITASGTRACSGTIVADPEVYPLGTLLNVPGYGKGIVEDVGGAIKGQHIDLWFNTHQEAVRWGKRWVKVDVVGEKKTVKNSVEH